MSDSPDTEVTMKRRNQEAKAIKLLRKRTTRNMPAAGACFTLAFFLFMFVCADGTMKLGQRNVISVEGLGILAVAFGLVYAGIRLLWVSQRDRIMCLLVENMIDRHTGNDRVQGKLVQIHAGQQQARSAGGRVEPGEALSTAGAATSK